MPCPSPKSLEFESPVWETTPWGSFFFSCTISADISTKNPKQTQKTPQTPKQTKNLQTKPKTNKKIMLHIFNNKNAVQKCKVIFLAYYLYWQETKPRIFICFFFFKKESQMNKKTENHKIISLKNETQTVKDIHPYGWCKTLHKNSMRKIHW